MLSAGGRQCAALPFALDADGTLLVMLVTSRTTERWILPKGWIEADEEPSVTAAREAYEEAGVVGTVVPEPVGVYSYDKRRRGGQWVRCSVEVYPLEVERQLSDWPERKVRRTAWFSADAAVELVAEPELKLLIAACDGRAAERRPA